MNPLNSTCYDWREHIIPCDFKGVELVGVYGRQADRSGVDVGEAIGHGTKIGVELTNDLPGMLSSAKPDVVIQATFSRIEQAAVEIKTAVQGKANVISIFQYVISLLRYNSKKRFELHPNIGFVYPTKEEQ